MNKETITVSQVRLAKILGLTDRRIRQLIAGGIISKLGNMYKNPHKILEKRVLTGFKFHVIINSQFRKKSHNLSNDTDTLVAA